MADPNALSLDICTLVKNCEGKMSKTEIQASVVAALGELALQGIVTADNLYDAVLYAVSLHANQPAEVGGN